MISEHLGTVRAGLAAVGLELPDDAYVFSNDPMGARPWNPAWATHKASDLAAAAGLAPCRSPRMSGPLALDMHFTAG
jgi:hypothetical protein